MLTCNIAESLSSIADKITCREMGDKALCGIVGFDRPRVESWFIDERCIDTCTVACSGQMVAAALPL